MILAFSRLELRLGTFLISQVAVLDIHFLAAVPPHGLEEGIFSLFFLSVCLSSLPGRPLGFVIKPAAPSDL